MIMISVPLALFIIDLVYRFVCLVYSRHEIESAYAVGENYIRYSES